MSIFSFISEFAGFSSNALAIDLGTVNTLIAIHGAGIVLSEATAVAVADEDDSVILAVGNEAVEMCGRTPTGVVLRYPFKNGVIANYRLAEYMIKEFFHRAMKLGAVKGIYASPRVLICVPACITDVERRAVCEVVKNSGARDVLVADEIMAACVGSGLPYSEPVGSMVVDVGGGTSDVAIVVLGGIAVSKSIRLGGNHADQAIVGFIRKEHNMLIGTRTAERIKMLLTGDQRPKQVEVSGLNIETGLPKSLLVSTEEVEQSLKGCIDEIVNMIKDLLAITPPELAGDVLKSGITLCGGGAMLWGLKSAIENATGLNVTLSKNPLECVALGAMELLDNTRRGQVAVGL